MYGFNTAFNLWIFHTKGELPIKRMVIENSIRWEYKSWWTRSDIEYSPMSNVKVNKFQILPSRSCSVRIERGFFCHGPNPTWNFLSQNVLTEQMANRNWGLGGRWLQLHYKRLTKNYCVTYGWNLTVLVLNGQFRIIFFLAKSGSYRKPPMNILARVNIYLIFRQDGYPPPVGNLTKTRFDIPQYTLCMLQGTFI